MVGFLQRLNLKDEDIIYVKAQLTTVMRSKITKRILKEKHVDS